MSAIALSGVTKVFGSGTAAVDGVDLVVDEGEFVALLGPTGCGKTTILRIVAGLEVASGGSVSIDGRPVDHLPVRERHVAMVFQDFALYPHLTVAENIAFPLRTEASPDDTTVSARVGEVARLVGVEDLLRRKPAQLSGGQRQRVAMARAIVRRPVAFLLDEPLSNVDAALRAELRTEIVNVTRALRVGTLYVTHDQTEAMTMADRIAVMRQGRIEQVGTPSEIYADPHRLFVAAFVGTPRTSLLQAAVYRRPGTEAVLDLGPLGRRQRAVVGVGQHFAGQLVDGGGQPLCQPAGVDEDDGRAVLADQLEDAWVDRRPDAPSRPLWLSANHRGRPAESTRRKQDATGRAGHRRPGARDHRPE